MSMVTVEQGIHTITASQYHSLELPTPALSASVAKHLINNSPKHAWTQHPQLNPNYKREESTTLDYGTVVHQVLLEGNTDNIVVVDANDWRTKAAKEQRDEAYASGRTPILERQMDKVQEMVDEAFLFIQSTEFKDVFSKGKPEQSVVWHEPEADIWCKARPDFVTHDGSIVLDYKTTVSAEPNAFSRQLVNLDYDLQAAFYLRGLRNFFDVEPVFIFLAQEKEAPYSCSLASIGGKLMEVADRKVETAINSWAWALKNNTFEGYPTQVAYADCPEWLAGKWGIQ